MIICHCKAVSDRTIRTAIRCGAESPREIGRATGAGGFCGGCRPALKRLLEKERAAAATAGDPIAAQAADATLVATG